MALLSGVPTVLDADPVWAAPVDIDLGILGVPSSFANGIEGGIVVGQADLTNGDIHAFAYDLDATTPTMVDLGTLGGSDSFAYDSASFSAPVPGQARVGHHSVRFRPCPTTTSSAPRCRSA